jgi:hypothetical protein
MINKYTYKPDKVEALQFICHSFEDNNLKELRELLPIEKYDIDIHITASGKSYIYAQQKGEGKNILYLYKGDYIVKHSNGRVVSVPEEIFKNTFDLVPNPLLNFNLNDFTDAKFKL